MGRNIICGIATKIKVCSKVSIQDNKENILKRIGSVFDLKYYDIVDEEHNNCLHLYLKEDLFNEKINELMKELANVELFRYEMYSSICSIGKGMCDEKQKKRK